MQSRIMSIAALSALLLSTTAVLAADLGGGYKDRTRADADVPEASNLINWSGLYVGGHIGYGISQHSLTTTTTEFPAVPSNCWSQTNINGETPNDNGTPDDETDDYLSPVAIDLGVSVQDVSQTQCDEMLAGEDPVDDPEDDIDLTYGEGFTPAADAYTVTDVLKNRTSDSGLIGGARVGFDIARSRILFGVFGDYNWSDIDGMDGEWTAAARLGYIVAPRTMAYVLAGYTQSDYNFGGNDVTFGGITAGGGIEFAVSSNVFLGLEYQHTFYDEETILDVPGLKVEDELDVDRILATVKFKLNSDLVSLR